MRARRELLGNTGRAPKRAVRRQIVIGGVGAAWRPALDSVWDFLAGEVAVHVGPYDRMKETHDAIHAWRAANHRAFAGLVGRSGEIRNDDYVSAQVAGTTGAASANQHGAHTMARNMDVKTAIQNGDAEPLHYVSDMGFDGTLKRDSELPLIEALIAAGADLDFQKEREDGKKSDTPLIGAASLAAEDVGLRLLDAGARPDLRGLFGETALHWAAFLGEYRLAESLIEGSDVNLKDDKYNSSPLGWAVHGRYNPPAGNQGKQCEVAALLVRAGAKIESEWLESEQVRADAAMLAMSRKGGRARFTSFQKKERELSFQGLPAERKAPGGGKCCAWLLQSNREAKHEEIPQRHPCERDERHEHGRALCADSRHGYRGACQDRT
jgi:hypothetical protein